MCCPSPGFLQPVGSVSSFPPSFPNVDRLPHPHHTSQPPIGLSVSTLLTIQSVYHHLACLPAANPLFFPPPFLPTFGSAFSYPPSFPPADRLPYLPPTDFNPIRRSASSSPTIPLTLRSASPSPSARLTHRLSSPSANIPPIR
jgi:hypothetical protein